MTVLCFRIIWRKIEVIHSLLSLWQIAPPRPPHPSSTSMHESSPNVIVSLSQAQRQSNSIETIWTGSLYNTHEKHCVFIHPHRETNIPLWCCVVGHLSTCRVLTGWLSSRTFPAHLEKREHLSRINWAPLASWRDGEPERPGAASTTTSCETNAGFLQKKLIQIQKLRNFPKSDQSHESLDGLAMCLVAGCETPRRPWLMAAHCLALVFWYESVDSGQTVESLHLNPCSVARHRTRHSGW